jgi:SurA N-terminal domain
MKKIIFVMVILFACKAYGEDLNHLVAKVNDEVITSKDLNDYCNILRQQFERNRITVDINPSSPQFKKKALNRLIEEKLVLAAAKEAQKKREEDIKKDERNAKYRIEAPQAWVEEQVGKAAANYPSRDDFEKSLAENGLNNFLFREHLKDQYLMQYIVETEVSRNANVSPQETLGFYNKHKDSFKAPMQYVLLTAHFYDKGAWQKFERFFKEKGIAAAQKEFTLEHIETSLNRLRREFIVPLRNLKVGGDCNVGIDGDVYFFYLKEKVPPRALAYAEAERMISGFLSNKKFRYRYAVWLKGLRDKAYIKSYL